jgi:hypothetical protein
MFEWFPRETKHEGGQKMPEGKVKWFNDSKGFGIIPRFREKVSNPWPRVSESVSMLFKAKRVQLRRMFVRFNIKSPFYSKKPPEMGAFFQ